MIEDTKDYQLLLERIWGCMNIIEEKFNWKHALSNRLSTKKIILHHAAAKNATVQDIHRWHLENGWSGIGYHFYIRKDGSIYQGRPITALGAHCHNNNSDSIGICFEGNFDVEDMTNAQIVSGQELISYILGRFPGIGVYGHKDFNATGCPGKNFRMDKFKNVGGSSTSATIIDKGENEMVTLKIGSKGTDVKILQRLLVDYSYNLAIDGSFGPATETAVKVFQTSYGLGADGIVGPKTWDALANNASKIAAADTAKYKDEILALKKKIETAKLALN